MFWSHVKSIRPLYFVFHHNTQTLIRWLSLVPGLAHDTKQLDWSHFGLNIALQRLWSSLLYIFEAGAVQTNLLYFNRETINFAYVQYCSRTNFWNETMKFLAQINNGSLWLGSITSLIIIRCGVSHALRYLRLGVRLLRLSSFSLVDPRQREHIYFHNLDVSIAYPRLYIISQTLSRLIRTLTQSQYIHS